ARARADDPTYMNGSAGAAATALRSRLQRVTYAPDRADDPETTCVTQLAADVGDVHVDDVARRGQVFSPDVVLYLFAAVHAPWLAGQVGKQLVLARAELDLVLAPQDLAPDRIDGHLAYLLGSAKSALAQLHVDASQQFLDVERLRQVIVCACIEHLDLGANLVGSRQDQDRSVAGAADAPGDLLTAHVG